MTQKQFAEYFRIPYRTLEDWERGDSAYSGISSSANDLSFGFGKSIR